MRRQWKKPLPHSSRLASHPELEAVAKEARAKLEEVLQQAEG